LFGAFAVSSVALIPDQSAAAFAAEVLVSGLLMLLAQLSIQLRSWTATEGVSPTRQIIRLIVNVVASLPFIVGGALMLSGVAGGIIALVTAVWNAWVLLIEILR
jgi:hypothetical protein